MPRMTKAASRTDGAASGAGRRGAKKRDREVLEAAARVFYERGYSDASVQDVADELGILKGSLYHYIKTKEDLLYRLLQETHDEIYEILEEVAAMEGLSPLERLEVYVRRQVEYNTDNLLRVSVYYHDLDRLSPERRKEIFARRREHERWVIAQIDEAKALGLADPTLDSRIAARCLFATIIWTYRWYRKGRDSRQKVAETCASFVLHGLTGNAVARSSDTAGPSTSEGSARPRARRRRRS